eukprot:6772922-Prymnesium_polylepis.1
MQPRGTNLTIGMCGTDGAVHGGPAIIRCRVNPNSSAYSAAVGWDPAGTTGALSLDGTSTTPVFAGSRKP